MPRRSRRSATLCVGRRNNVCGEKPQQRNAANARERARMRVLSRAFCRLKTTLPWVPPDTKLSKLDTLRLATSYIAHLRNLVGADDATDVEHIDSENHPHPTSLTWPYSFPRGVSSSLKAHFEPESILPDDEDVEEEEEGEEDWSQCSSEDISGHQQPRSDSFLAHFTDVLMDIS